MFTPSVNVDAFGSVPNLFEFFDATVDTADTDVEINVFLPSVNVSIEF